jgi:hypothetical protein
LIHIWITEMPSNRVVTYIDINLNSIEQYWGELVVPNAQAFQSEPSPRTLFNVASSVWHLHDWVWHDRNPGIDSRGLAFDAYRMNLLGACPELGWLRDIADAGKHRGLGRLPDVKGAEPKIVGGSSYLVLGFPGPNVLKFFLVFNDRSLQAVDEVLRTAVEFWRTDLKPKDLASPFA